MIALSDAGISAEAQRPIRISYRGKPVGDFYADILVDD